MASDEEEVAAEEAAAEAVEQDRKRTSRRATHVLGREGPSRRKTTMALVCFFLVVKIPRSKRVLNAVMQCSALLVVPGLG